MVNILSTKTPRMDLNVQKSQLEALPYRPK